MQVFGEIGRRGPFQVADDCPCAQRLQVVDLFGLADQPGHGVAALREQAFQATGDLAVSTGDDDMHSGDGTAAPRTRR
ncbi:hypothetical protein GCM10010430_63250 [Kitasatospora cystarginea]|uniref:Uncharacterized protein n=1 Tax=Kitasatospora cystarginea TaxID=58350 RepID=A0ABN3ESR7_9ACTN